MTSSGVQPNSPSAVANVQNEKVGSCFPELGPKVTPLILLTQDYYNVLDSHCSDLKAVPGGGVGWFAHIYSDAQEPGYGIYDASETTLKFPFSPRTSC